MMGGKKKAVNGYLYNLIARQNANFAPVNWRVPLESDFAALGVTVSNNPLILVISGTSYWTTNFGTNTTNFSALGSGIRYIDGTFYGYKLETSFGISDITGNDFQILDNDNNWYQNGQRDGSSVRLIYTGGGTPPSTLIDYDGNVYDVIQIGTQYWTKQNWKCTKLNNGTAIPNVTDGATWAGLTTLARCAYNNDESLV